MTVSVYGRFSLNRGRLIVFHLVLQELAQDKALLAQTLCVFITVEQVDQFIPEHSHAAGLKAYNRHSVANRLAQRCHRLPKQSLCSIEHAVVVERPAAR